jgi:signal transduction histidine kinase
MALVDDLLRFSRAGNNMNPQVTSLNRLVQIATENLRMAIDEARAEVIVDPLPEVSCDAGMLVQVFQNLIGNAVKFSEGPGRGRVQVSAEDRDTSWVISVKDNGIGIEPEYHAKIFTPFYRLYSTAEYPGTGIGLALCQKIVRAHGGEIWAESGGRGKGTTLYFTLPKVA